VNIRQQIEVDMEGATREGDKGYFKMKEDFRRKWEVQGISLESDYLISKWT